jgi:hypothetical protein
MFMHKMYASVLLTASLVYTPPLAANSMSHTDEATGNAKVDGSVNDLFPKAPSDVNIPGNTPKAGDNEATTANPNQGAGKSSDAPKESSENGSKVNEMAVLREASLRRTAEHLGLNYDTLLTRKGAVKKEPEGQTPTATEPPAEMEPDEKRRFDGRRLRALVKHALELATEPEVNAIVSELVPSKKVALCLKVLGRVGTIVKGKSRESGSDGNLAAEHDLAKQNPDAFAEAIEEELAERKDAEQLALLQKKQAAELELLEKRQDVARSERGLNRARAAAEIAEKAVQEAAQAREQKPAADGQ